MMKYFIALFLCMWICVPVFCQSDSTGIKFENGTLADAIAKAKHENKKIMVDCYTTWCGPCKMLTARTFPVKEVGEFMNPQFVSIKIDMEKGEGPQVAKQFNVKAYPTIVFLNSDGTLINQLVGFREADRFIADVKNVILGQSGIERYDASYAAGERADTFLIAYVERLISLSREQDAMRVAQQVLENKTIEFKQNPDLLKLAFNFLNDPTNETFLYLNKHAREFQGISGAEQLEKYLDAVWAGYATSFLGKTGLDQAKFKDYVALMKKEGYNQSGYVIQRTQLLDKIFKEDWKEGLKRLKKHYTAYPNDHTVVFGVITAMNEKMADMKIRKEAADFLNIIIATEEKNTIKGGENMLIPYLKKTQADLQQEMKTTPENK